MRNTRRFIREYFKNLTLGVGVLVILFISALYLFFFIAHEVFWEKEDEVDQAIFSYLSAHVISYRLTSFMEQVTHFASARFLRIAYGVLIIVYLLKKEWKRSLEIIAIGLGGSALNHFMKNLFQRHRPPDPLIERLENFSFPSGHATAAFIFYGLLTYLIWQTEISKAYKWVLASLLILFSLLIGFSRVYLRVHYASDVLAGFCVGFAWLIVTISLLERLKKKSFRRIHTKANGE